jgi:DNA-binding transcriptional regulator LsrR (DeoR family)
MMAGWEDDLERVAGEIDDAREELDRLYEERAELIAYAYDDGATQADVARALGVSHTAVQKMTRPTGE